MATTVEPIQSFAYLCDNIPQWLNNLEELNAQCDQQSERCYNLTKQGEMKLIRKKKHDSTDSLRLRDDVANPLSHTNTSKDPLSVPTTSTAVPAEASRPSHINTFAPPTPNQHTLKRKQASASSAASGRGGHRTKSMIVVYYDSAIQESFEGIVKNISNARSKLRKGRTTATFQARMASMAPSFDHSDALPSSKFIMPTFGRIREDATEKQQYKAYDESDRELEEAQNLSEKAAHQLLRNGECNTEMRGMRKRFRAVLATAEKEHERLKTKLDSTDLLEASKSVAGKDASSFTFPPLLTPRLPSAPIEIENSPAKQMHFAATGAIEVDDAASDESSIQIDMNAVRRVTRRPV